MAYNNYQQATLAQVPTSHAELRMRLEAAGVPPEQIMQVMLQPGTQQPYGYPAPPLPSYMAPPSPSYLAAPPSNGMAPPPPAYAAGHQSYPGTQYPPHPPPQKFNSPSEIIYKMHRSTKPKVLFTTKDTLLLARSTTSPSYPTWTMEFKRSKPMSKEPDFRMHRHSNFNPSPNAMHQICECVYHRHGGDYTIEITHPWLKWPEPWNPETQPWISDVGDGVLGKDEEFRWFWGEEDPDFPGDQTVFTCRHIPKGSSTEEKKGEVLCRAVLLDCKNSGEVGEVRLPERIWGRAMEEQLDEMVSNAMIQLYRHAMDWMNPPPRPARRTNGDSSAATIAAISAVNACSTSTVC